MKIDYRAKYERYKKMPLIGAITIFCLSFVWSIIDVIISTIRYDDIYGVFFDFESAFVVLIVWWLIGAVVAGLYYSFSTLTIAPMVVQTDAILNIETEISKIKHKLNQEKNSRNVEPPKETPKLNQEKKPSNTEPHQEDLKPEVDQSSVATNKRITTEAIPIIEPSTDLTPEDKEKQKIYDEAILKMKLAEKYNSPVFYVGAIKLLDTIKGYSNVEELIDFAKKKEKECNRKK